jgi:hypothetical protein
MADWTEFEDIGGGEVSYVPAGRGGASDRRYAPEKPPPGWADEKTVRETDVLVGPVYYALKK